MGGGEGIRELEFSHGAGEGGGNETRSTVTVGLSWVYVDGDSVNLYRRSGKVETDESAKVYVVEKGAFSVLISADLAASGLIVNIKCGTRDFDGGQMCVLISQMELDLKIGSSDGEVCLEDEGVIQGVVYCD